MWLTVALAATLLVAIAVDALLVRGHVTVEQAAPTALARGQIGRLVVTPAAPVAQVRQPASPDLLIEPETAAGALTASISSPRRGLHALPRPALRRRGPIGLGATQFDAGQPHEVRVLPDLIGARRIARAVADGRDPSLRRGPLGLGTEFESIRDYAPDDDIRQVNWRASERAGRPMSNVYRVEQDRDLLLLLDAGRLLAAPADEAATTTLLDVAVDAAAAVAAVTEVTGDRAGALVFDREIRRHLRPRRRAARAIAQAIFDVEPSASDSDYELAFRTAGGGKRSFVVIFTDLFDEQAAAPLVRAMPVLVRRHAVCVASCDDIRLAAYRRREPATALDALAASVTAVALESRDAVATQLRQRGAQVVIAAPDRLALGVVREYLRAKAAGRA